MSVANDWPDRNGTPSHSRATAVARRIRRLLASTLLVAVCSASAGELPKPEGRVLLTVDGTIGVTNADGEARFDRTMLEDLGLQRMETDLPWTDGPVVFEGPTARSVLEAVDAQGKQVTATALNDYSIDIPVSDFMDYDVILAMKRDGDRLSVRERGPLWIIYPLSEHDELQGDIYLNRHVWQLARITVK